MPLRRCSALALCALLLLALAPSVVRAQGQPDGDLYSLSVEEGLSRAVSGQIGPLEAFPFLQRAAQSKNPTSISALKKLAMRYAKDEYLSRYSEELEYNAVAHTAMYALRKKGVPQSYFLNLARQYKKDKWPAFYAATILAIHPDAETLALIQKMRKHFDDAYIDGVYDASLYARGQFERYEQMGSLEGKADFLIEWAGRGYQALAGGLDWDSEHHLHPASVRAREELRSFSQKHPTVVARQLSGIDLEHGSTRKYQRHVGKYLAEASRAELKRLMKAQRAERENASGQQ